MHLIARHCSTCAVAVNLAVPLERGNNYCKINDSTLQKRFDFAIQFTRFDVLTLPFAVMNSLTLRERVNIVVVISKLVYFIFGTRGSRDCFDPKTVGLLSVCSFRSRSNNRSFWVVHSLDGNKVNCHHLRSSWHCPLKNLSSLKRELMPRCSKSSRKTTWLS